MGKIFSLNYSDSSNISKINTNSSLILQEDSRGIGANAQRPNDATTLAALVKYADETFSNEAKAAPKSEAVLILVELEPYNTVPKSSTIPDWPNDVMGLVSSRISLYERLLTYVGDIAFATGLPTAQQTALYEDDATAIMAKATKAQALRDAFVLATEFCKNLLDNGVSNPAGVKECGDKMTAAITEQKVAEVKLRVK